MFSGDKESVKEQLNNIKDLISNANIDLGKNYSNDKTTKIMFFEKNRDFLNSISVDEFRDILLASDIKISIEQLVILWASFVNYNYNDFDCLTSLLDSKYNNEEIMDFWSYNILLFIFLHKYRIDSAREILKNSARLFSDNDESLINFIDSLDEKIKPNKFDRYAYSYNNLFLMSRLLLNKKIVMNNDVKLLEEYSKDYDRNMFIDILVNAYGEHVRDIFNYRPNLDIYSFYSFDILDKSILDNFGINFINILLSFDYSKYLPIICVITNNSVELRRFKKYYDFYLGIKKDFNITDLTRIFSTYGKMSYLFDSLDLDNLSEIERYNLKLLIVDDNVLVSKINRDNLKDYLDIRKDYYKERVNDSFSLKSNLFEYLTGRHVNVFDDTINSMNLEQTIKVFNIRNILKDESLIKNIRLTDDDVALLLLLNKVYYITDEKVLRDIYNAVIDCKYISPILFRNTFDKIKDYYTVNLKDSLISSKKLDAMDSMDVDGIDVIKFEGESYNMLCSVTEMYMADKSFLHPYILLGQDLLDDWLHREIGRSTISCALACDGVTIHPDNNGARIVFVFDNNLPIIGMGGSDIYAIHENGDNSHRFNDIMGTKLRFASIDEMKHDIEESRDELKKFGTKKFTSEVVLPRYDEDLRGNVLNRTMPIGIYIEGEITKEVIDTAKVFKKYYQDNGLGKFRVIQVNLNKYRSNIYPDNYNDKRTIERRVEWLEEVTEPIKRSSR